MTERESSDGETIPAVGLTVGVIALVSVHLLALVVFPAGPRLSEALLLEGLAGAVVAGSLLATGERLQWALLAGTGAAAGALATWLVTTAIPLWQVAVGALFVVAVTSYGIHRVELLTMGLLEEST